MFRAKIIEQSCYYLITEMLMRDCHKRWVFRNLCIILDLLSVSATRPPWAIPWSASSPYSIFLIFTRRFTPFMIRRSRSRPRSFSVMAAIQIFIQIIVQHNTMPILILNNSQKSVNSSWSLWYFKLFWVTYVSSSSYYSCTLKDDLCLLFWSEGF